MSLSDELKSKYNYDVLKGSFCFCVTSHRNLLQNLALTSLPQNSEEDKSKITKKEHYFITYCRCYSTRRRWFIH